MNFSEPGRTEFDQRGWRVVGAMFLLTATIFGFTIYGFIILAHAMASARGWSSSQAGNLVSAMWVLAPLALVCGPLIERVGAWKLLLTGVALTAALFAVLPLTNAYWQLYLLRVVMGGAKTFATIVMPVIVARNFHQRFGMAVAMAWCGGAFGGLVIAPLSEMLVQAAGWQRAALVMAGAMATSALAIVGLGCGADRRISERRPSAAADRNFDWTAVRAINPWTALVMAIAVATLGVAALSFTIQSPVLLERDGFSPTKAASLLGLMAAGAMGGNLLAGWLLDRTPATVTGMVGGLMTMAGLALFTGLRAAPVALFAAVSMLLVGAGIGAFEILWITLTKRQFGVALFAVTYGGWALSYEIGYASAGAIGGTLFDALSGTGFVVAIGLLCAPAALFAMWRPGMRNEVGPIATPRLLET